MNDSPAAILYSFRRCPYAMRARLAIAASNICVEVREVILRDKPLEMLEISPKATVPVLLLPDGTVIDESLDIMLWALKKNDPKCWLQGDTGAMTALIQRCEKEFKYHLDRYKYASRYDGADPLCHREAACSFLSELEARLEQHAFLFGEKLTLADAAIAPFVRQFANTDRKWFAECQYGLVRQWVHVIVETDLFKSVMHKYTQWHAGSAPVFFNGEVS